MASRSVISTALRVRDFIVTHLTEDNHALWKQGPPVVSRSHCAHRAGIAALARTGFGAVFADSIRMPRQIWIVNGRVAAQFFRARLTTSNPDLSPHWNQYAERNQLFRNESAGAVSDGRKFRDISLENGRLCKFRASPAHCLRRYNGDGAIDLLSRISRKLHGLPECGVRARSLAAGASDRTGAGRTRCVWRDDHTACRNSASRGGSCPRAATRQFMIRAFTSDSDRSRRSIASKYRPDGLARYFQRSVIA